MGYRILCSLNESFNPQKRGYLIPLQKYMEWIMYLWVKISVVEQAQPNLQKGSESRLFHVYSDDSSSEIRDVYFP
jgi:hypothetical protein